jgi:flavin-dependent dehydrogenase
MGKEKIYEVIVIGAGPAGLIAGKNLLGNFLILDNKKEIGKPVQHVGMSVESFKRFGMSENAKWVKSKIHKIERIMPNNKKIGRYKKDYVGYVVERKSFEEYLSENIRSYIKTNVEVVNVVKNDDIWEAVASNGDIYKSKYIIGADGVNSIVRRKVFSEFKNNISLAFGLEYSVKFSKSINIECVKFYLNNEIYCKGYGWFFPTSDYTANIGVGSENKNLKFDDLIEKIIQENVKEYGDCNIISKTNGFTGSMVHSFPFFRDNVFLVGDAAGLNDPIFRAGTNQAMISAEIASECIKKNQGYKYDKSIKSLPFINSKIKKSSDIFYGFSNELLEEVGEVFENKGFSDIKNIFIFLKLLRKKEIRKNIFKLLYFLKIWEKSKEWLW